MVTSRWPVVVSVVLLASLTVLHVPAAARRNWAYRQLVRGARVSAPDTDSPADDRLALRVALAQSDWTSVASVVRAESGRDRLVALLVINDAGARVARGDREGARAALQALSGATLTDADVWYRIGAIYERFDAHDEALRAYDAGTRLDDAAPWAEGVSRAALVDQRRGAWSSVVDRLAPLLARASDADFARPVQLLEPNGAWWQGTFLSLGDAYAHLGRPAEAEAVYERLSRLSAPRRDWTWNRTLDYLARARVARGAFAEALDPFVESLDTAAVLDAADRRRFELDTAGDILRAVAQADEAQRLPDVAQAADARAARGDSAAAWFIRGVVNERRCAWAAAREDFARAAQLTPTGAGAHLAGHPAEVPCPRR